MATPIYMHVCTRGLDPVSKGHQVGLKSAMSLFAKETHKNRALFLCWYLYVRVGLIQYPRDTMLESTMLGLFLQKRPTKIGLFSQRDLII